MTLSNLKVRKSQNWNWKGRKKTKNRIRKKVGTWGGESETDNFDGLTWSNVPNAAHLLACEPWSIKVRIAADERLTIVARRYGVRGE